MAYLDGPRRTYPLIAIAMLALKFKYLKKFDHKFGFKSILLAEMALKF
jgi:hypothetical protein